LLFIGQMLFAQGPAEESYAEGEDIVFIQGDYNSFEEVLQPYRGKVVLLDFWATWCRPCIQEFPHYDKIFAFMKNEPNVILLYVSLDGDREKKWRDFVTNRELKGMHFLASRPIHLELYEEWKVTTIPRYMIISKEGEIIEKYASRPSQGKSLIRQLEKALNER
jgi:thiol-disulfide isomerase/thioredoxin